MVAASAVAHLAVLALVGLSAPKLAFRVSPPEPAIEVWLTPDLTPLVNRRTTPPAVLRPAQTGLAPIRPARPLPFEATALKRQPQKTPPAQPTQPTQPTQGRASQGEIAGGAHAPHSSPVGVEGGGGGVEGALRTSVGCDFEKTAHLTPEESEKCNQHYGEEARRQGSFNGIDPLKRGRFDAQAAADERRRAARTGPMQQPIEACGAVGCLPDSAITHFTPH
jgi:hypothetical protein